MYDEGWASPPANGDVTGVWGRRNACANGDVGAEDGVSGRAGYRRFELDAREEGREIGRRVGVRKRNGTPATSSRCLCIKSNTFCSNYSLVSVPKDMKKGLEYQTVSSSIA